MHCTAAALTTICIVAVSAGRSCTKSGGCGPARCGPLEVPVKGKPQRDSFCRPLFTPASEIQKLRSCLCKRRYLRNSWGECVPRAKCLPCKFRWQRDYRTCMPGCPATCKMPFGSQCNKPCMGGCDCPPGYVVNPRLPRMCMKLSSCPKCPENSSLKSCVSTCLPKCGKVPPKRCLVKCNRVDTCVCNTGYVELEQDGKKTCVLRKMCPPLKPNITRHTNEKPQKAEIANIPGRISVHSATAAIPISAEALSAAIGTSPLAAQSSGATLDGGVTTSVVPGGALTSGASAKRSEILAPTVEAGGHEPLPSNTAKAPSGGALGASENVVGATPTETASPPSIAYAEPVPSSRLPAAENNDYSEGTDLSRGADLFESYPSYTPTFTRVYSAAQSEYLPWAARLQGRAGYGITSFGFNPWATPSPVAARHYTTGLRFYPWKTALPGNNNYGTPGLGTDFWNSFSRPTPTYFGWNMALRSWHPYLLGLATNWAPGLQFNPGNLFVPGVTGF